MGHSAIGQHMRSARHSSKVAEGGYIRPIHRAEPPAVLVSIKSEGARTATHESSSSSDSQVSRAFMKIRIFGNKFKLFNPRPRIMDLGNPKET